MPFTITFSLSIFAVNSSIADLLAASPAAIKALASLTSFTRAERLVTCAVSTMVQSSQMAKQFLERLLSRFRMRFQLCFFVYVIQVMEWPPLGASLYRFLGWSFRINDPFPCRND